MQDITSRVKHNVSALVLTLLCIMQAFALALLWSFIVETPYLFALTWEALLPWLQVLITLIGTILVWVSYATNVTRFVWVPSMQEFVMPFAVGLIQFSIIQMLTVQLVGPWMVLVAVLILTINWIAHSTMRKARLDGDNGDFLPAKQRQAGATFNWLSAASLCCWPMAATSGFLPHLMLPRCL